MDNNIDELIEKNSEKTEEKENVENENLHSTNNSLLPAFTMISTSFLSTLVLKGKRQFMQIFFVRFQWFSILAALYSNHPELKANSIA